MFSWVHVEYWVYQVRLYPMVETSLINMHLQYGCVNQESKSWKVGLLIVKHSASLSDNLAFKGKCWSSFSFVKLFLTSSNTLSGKKPTISECWNVSTTLGYVISCFFNAVWDIWWLIKLSVYQSNSSFVEQVTAMPIGCWV